LLFIAADFHGWDGQRQRFFANVSQKQEGPGAARVD
jgi:hypothetical protein